jgi:cell division protein FtsL
VGFGLFHVKYQVMALEEELTRLNAATLREQNQIHVLEAEWSYLNRPSRLEELADRYLDLKPITPNQLGTIADLPKRPTLDDFVRDPNVIAKIMPPRKPPVPSVPVPAAQSPAMTASLPSPAPANAAHPLPAPVTPVGLVMEGR